MSFPRGRRTRLCPPSVRIAHREKRLQTTRIVGAPPVSQVVAEYPMGFVPGSVASARREDKSTAKDIAYRCFETTSFSTSLSIFTPGISFATIALVVLLPREFFLNVYLLNSNSFGSCPFLSLPTTSSYSFGTRTSAYLIASARSSCLSPIASLANA